MSDVAILKAALEQWKCPSCGGSGFYAGFSQDAPEGQPCRKCEGDGLHPIAAEALSRIEKGGRRD